MIAIAKAVSYAVNDLRYITGESNKKKHPEKIFRMHDNLLPSKMDAYGIWSAMQLHLGQYRKLKNSVITIRISPSRENTKHFNEDDWLKLWQDFVTEFDKPRMTDKNGKGVSVQTNIANSIHTVWLHHDAEGNHSFSSLLCTFMNHGIIVRFAVYVPATDVSVQMIDSTLSVVM